MQINLFHVDDPLRVITTAVTPAVMVSASAILIGGINSKHQSLSDRVRGLAAEFRGVDTPAPRKQVIREQIRYFRRRIRLVAAAHISLYCATACFVAMVIVISFTVKVSTLIVATLPFFLAGVALVFVAVVLEIRELRMSGETMRLELADLEGPENI